jgi:hypothetical protein
MRGNKTFLPCREGSCMTFLNGKYYLQFASPGHDRCRGIRRPADGRQAARAVRAVTFSPISRKDCGFITSAGTVACSRTVRNWWRAVTMLIGVNERMERRIGLFPAGFDAAGIPYTRTGAGRHADHAADGPRDQSSDDVFAGWWVLSRGAKVTTSSTLDEAHFGAELAADEDIRSWWSAKTGDAGEWLQMDLGDVQPSARSSEPGRAGLQPTTASSAPDAHRFVLKASGTARRGGARSTRRRRRRLAAHVRRVRSADQGALLPLENVFMPSGGKFAVSDLRIFGVAPAIRRRP